LRRRPSGAGRKESKRIATKAAQTDADEAPGAEDDIRSSADRAPSDAGAIRIAGRASKIPDALARPGTTFRGRSAIGFSADPMTISADTRLGPCEVLSPLGAGGMGEVYRARHTRLQRFQKTE
jgi:hypothetical protein